MSTLALETAWTGLPDCAAIAAELATQPEFFALFREELPDRPSSRPVLARARYNGQRCGDEAINLRVGAMRLLGLSDRAIERECGVDRRSIPYRLANLERARLIPALKERVAMRTGDLAERSAMVLGVLLDRAGDEVDADLASMIKAVATAHGITVDKMQLLTGGATEIVEHRARAGREDIEVWARQVGAVLDVVATPVDLESTLQPGVCEGKPAVSDGGHGTDTAADPVSGRLDAGGAAGAAAVGDPGGGRPGGMGSETSMG